MACLLKSHTSKSKGILSFTTQEERFIRNNHITFELFSRVKERYVTCLHYNWHNFELYPDNLFDIHLAGEDDLIVKNDLVINHFHFDCCNFTPALFRPVDQEKIWDVLYLARAVFFKGIEDFFKIIKSLYDDGYKLRVLLICPVPPENNKVSRKLTALYHETFSAEEKKIFNFLTLTENYPFFFDLYSLSSFYKSSKIFVHTAPDERRCRVAAYALCSGMPLVSLPPVASILPKSLRTEPWYYEAKSYDEFGDQIVRALADYKIREKPPALDYLGEEVMSEVLVRTFTDFFNKNSIFMEGDFYLKNLDIRMGRHHGVAFGPNNVSQSLNGFMSTLLELNENVDAESGTPEEDLLKIFRYGENELNTLPFTFRFLDKMKKIILINLKGLKIINIVKKL